MEMDPLRTIDPQDLLVLLNADRSEWMGRIMQLNRAPRYHNTLDAIVLTDLLMELDVRTKRPEMDR
jgi:hypothetical protein